MDRPLTRPTLAALADDLNGWLSARQTKDEFAATYENEQARNLAVLRWLVELVRREPVFDQMSYDIRELDAPSDVSGLSESEVGQALLELDEAGLVDAEPHHVMGRTLPAYFSPVYPTLYGVEQVEDVDAITARAAPLLRAFVDEQNWLALPKTQEPVEIAPGLTLPPAEAYFQMCVLEQQDLLTFERLHESGGHASFVDIRTTVAGKAWLYRLGGSASAD